MDIEEIYNLFISDETILTLKQLSKRFGFGSKRYLKMCKALYKKYDKDYIKGISQTRLSYHRLKIRNSKPVKYSEESKKLMSKRIKESWNGDSDRRKLSANLIKKYANPKAHGFESRKKAVETRKKNDWPGHTEKWKQAVKLSNINRVVSDETRSRMRLAAIERMKKQYGQISPNYNKHACLIFEEINKEMNWSGQHAENGGEFFIKKLGYWVDYYEPTLNIVIEFDEKHHKYKKEKDIKRQKEIEEFLECKFYRITNNKWQDILNEFIR